MKTKSKTYLLDPTMTKTARRLYERALLRLFRAYRREVQQLFDDARQLEAIQLDLSAYEAAIEAAAHSVIIGPAHDVIQDRIKRTYINGIKRADPQSPGQLTPTDWRAIDALETRNLTALQKITTEMNGQIIRIISDSMLAGEHPRSIAKKITERVDNIGLARARTMARTETVTAFNRGAQIRYEQYGYTHWEWIAALDERTCPVCGALDGKVFKFGDSQDIPPAHPNCRCSIAPVEAP
jgi:SPP1 gp7 family putative phage head morphogenesis protein